MLTFQEIFSRLPVDEERSVFKFRYVFIFILLCLFLFSCLLFVGSYWNNKTLSYFVPIPLLLMPLPLLAYVILEVWTDRQMFAKPDNWMLGWLDRRFAEEKMVAEEMAKEDVFEIKSMRDRLEAELLARERWAEVLKPFSILIPALLIVSSSNIFNFQDAAQNFMKLIGAALLSGLSIGAILVYTSIVKLRRLLSTLQRAICVSDERKNKAILKISRKRDGNGLVSKQQ